MAARKRTTRHALLGHVIVGGREPDAHYDAPRLGEVKHAQGDVSIALRDLGYAPSVSVEEGVRLTLEWFSG